MQAMAAYACNRLPWSKKCDLYALKPTFSVTFNECLTKRVAIILLYTANSDSVTVSSMRFHLCTKYEPDLLIHTMKSCSLSRYQNKTVAVITPMN